MKNLLKFNLLAVFVLVFCTMMTAQDKQQRMNREELAKKQANYIATQMAFDETTTQRFIETYCAYQQEVWALGPNHKEEPTNEQRLSKPSRNALNAANKSSTCVKNITKSTVNS